MVSSRLNHDIKEQETGVDLALKLPQIAPITTTPGGRLAPRTALFNGFEFGPTERHFALRYGRGSISLGRRYQLTNSSHRARGESFISCSAPHSPFLTIAFFSLPNSSATNRGSCHPFLPLKTPAARFPGRHLSLSLSLPRHSDILRHNVEKRRTQGSFSFSFLTPNESRRPSPCQERVVYPPLFDDCRGFGELSGTPLLFFFLSTRFATSLTFVFSFFSSASRIKREFSGPSRAFPPTPTHSPATSSPCSSTRAPSALERKIFLRRRGDSGSGSQASTLRQQENVAEELAPLPSSWQHSVSDKDVVKPRMSKIGEPKVRFLSLSHSKRVGRLLLAESALFTLLSLLFAADSGTRQRAIAFFLLSTRFATSLTFVFSFFFLSFSHQARVLRPQQSLSADADPLSSNILALLLDASTVGTRAEDLSPSTGIPAAVLKQALYDSKGTSPRSTRPLPSSRRQRKSAPSPTRTSSSLERRALSERPPRNGESVSITFHQLTSAGRVFKFASALAPSCHHLSPDLEERRTSGRRSRLSQVMSVLFFAVCRARRRPCSDEARFVDSDLRRVSCDAFDAASSRRISAARRRGRHSGTCARPSSRGSGRRRRLYRCRCSVLDAER